MKKIVSSILCLMLMVSMAFAAFAGISIPGGELRSRADSLDLTSNVQGSVEEITSLHAQGVRLFDTAGLLSGSDADRTEEILDQVSDETGWDLAVFTTDGFSGVGDARRYSDYIYSKAGLGSGEKRSGTILVVNMTDRDVYIYTYGDAVTYMTDNQLNYIYDEMGGGLYGSLQSGEYGRAFEIFAAGAQDAYLNADAATSYKKKGLTVFEVIASVIVSAIAGILPVTGVRKKYAMQTEKRQAEGFNMAYRANSVMNLAAGSSAARLISKNVTRAPIPVNTGGSNRPGGGHGGGTSTVHTSMGGGVHGGAGRKF